MNKAFYACVNLKTIYCDHNWKWRVDNCGSSNAPELFYGCFNLVGGNNTAYDTNHTDVEFARPDGENGNFGYFTSSQVCSYAIWCEDVQTLYFAAGPMGSNMYDIGGSFNGQNITNVWQYFENMTKDWKQEVREQCKQVVFDESFQTVSLSNLKSFFCQFSNLSSIEGLEFLNTNNGKYVLWM